MISKQCNAFSVKRLAFSKNRDFFSFSLSLPCQPAGAKKGFTPLEAVGQPGSDQRLLAGFTLIELMLVVVIIGVLASMVMPKLVGKSEQAKKSVAQADIEASISSALELYEIDNGKFPESLSVLVGKYLKKDPKDPWGNPYNYKSPGDHNQDSYDIYSKGKDGMEGTEDDITNWK